MSEKILVTPRSLTASGGAGLERLTAAGFELMLGPPGRQPRQEELVSLVPGCVGWLAGVEPITAAVLERADALRVISRNGTGVDNVDLQAAGHNGIEVRRAPAANADGVAELALTLALWCLRGLGPGSLSVRGGGWERVLGSELRAARVGIVGCGAVGRRLIGLVLALGGHVAATDIRRPDDLPRHPSFRFAGLTDVLSASDVISLHAPASAEGRPLIGTTELELMPRGAHLVNTARAGLVDEAAVLQALDDGGLASYATDVFASEPPGQDPLMRHPRVVATPHVGGFTRESVARATDAAVTNLLDVLRPGSAVAVSAE